ncbi:flavodoxin family protein [Sulfitobacter sp. 1151]|uniref:Flavodoxin family protein n=1 Tax=Parasulfitobacter algicola TaxID=2614809 RepID=A0ABX2IL68_9RHOB|nr:flavodoxin family protein [Sulfitobacter algicola]
MGGKNLTNVEVIYVPGHGTAQHAQAVCDGAAQAANANVLRIPENGEITDDIWNALDAADAILFGSPADQDDAPWQIRKLAAESAKRWSQDWQDKIAGGFAVRDRTKGDAMQYFNQMAVQHDMTWVSLGEPDRNTLLTARLYGKRVAELAEMMN